MKEKEVVKEEAMKEETAPEPEDLMKGEMTTEEETKETGKDMFTLQHLEDDRKKDPKEEKDQEIPEGWKIILEEW